MSLSKANAEPQQQARAGSAALSERLIQHIFVLWSFIGHHCDPKLNPRCAKR